jgi:hypothetical protein
MSAAFKVWSKYLFLLEKNPIVTKCCTGSVIASAGDVFAQYAMFRNQIDVKVSKKAEQQQQQVVSTSAPADAKMSLSSSSSLSTQDITSTASQIAKRVTTHGKRKDDDNLWEEEILLDKSIIGASSTFQWDKRRTFSLFVFGVFYAGAFQHYLFAFYGRLFPMNSLQAALKTVALHQFGTYPFIYFPAFYGITEGIRGRSFEETKERFKEHFFPAYSFGLILWTPAMLIQFLFIPLPLQVLWISSCSLIWTTYLSFTSL